MGSIDECHWKRYTSLKYQVFLFKYVILEGLIPFMSFKCKVIMYESGATKSKPIIGRREVTLAKLS
jgi:hypothetical protein